MTVDPVHDLMIVSGGDDLRIFDRTSSGNTPRSGSSLKPGRRG